MITKWKVFNFKSVRKETELDFAPLTIFAGANSSGKSTFLQSILLVGQTLAHKVSSRSVVLNGAFVRLGQFDDLRSADSEANQIVVGWTCQPAQDPRTVRLKPLGFRRSPFLYGQPGSVLSFVSCEIAFDTDDSGALKEVTQVQPRLFSSLISALTRDPEGGDQRHFMSIRRATSEDDLLKRQWRGSLQGEDVIARASMEYNVELDNSSLAEIRDELLSAKPVGCVLRHFLADRISVGVDMAIEDARVIVALLCGDGLRALPRRVYIERDVQVPASVIEFVLNVARHISDDAHHALFEKLSRKVSSQISTTLSLELLLDAIRSIGARFRMDIRRRLAESEEFERLVTDTVRRERKEEYAVQFCRAPGAIAEASRFLDEFFSSGVRYLGPLRDEPKSLYPLSPTADPSDIGVKGEYTAAVLDLHKNRSIRYVPTSAFAEAEVKTQISTRTLESAVVDWLKYLGVAENVQSRDRGKLGHELKVNISGTRRPHDLTHVGVGVSQVLPILVASLLAEPDTTLIFEQPELHLHPRVQTLLGDFFLSMTALGKQCIVETHSEYLINRVRFRVAAAQASNPWVAATKVYFVERPEGMSTFREVKINEFGAILDWPEGFFDQSQFESESILRAATAKKKMQRGK